MKSGFGGTSYARLNVRTVVWFDASVTSSRSKRATLGPMEPNMEHRCHIGETKPEEGLLVTKMVEESQRDTNPLITCKDDR